MRIFLQSPRTQSNAPGAGLLGLLMLPVMLLIGAVAFVISLPVIVVLYFYSRHKLKKFFRAFQGEQETEEPTSHTGAKRVETVVVETVQTDETNPLLPGE